MERARADSTSTPELLCLCCNATLDTTILYCSHCLTGPLAWHIASESSPSNFVRAIVGLLSGRSATNPSVSLGPTVPRAVAILVVPPV